MSLSKRNTGYKILPQEDPIDIEFKPRPQKEDKYIAVLERVGSILHSLFWLGLAIASWYYAEIYLAYSDPRLRPIPFAISLFLGFVASCAFLYVFTDNFIKGSPNQDYLEAYPNAIKILTFTGLLFWIILTVALFPLWGWKTIPVIFVNFMALILSPNLIPL